MALTPRRVQYAAGSSLQGAWPDTAERRATWTYGRCHTTSCRTFGCPLRHRNLAWAHAHLYLKRGGARGPGRCGSTSLRTRSRARAGQVGEGVSSLAPDNYPEDCQRRARPARTAATRRQGTDRDRGPPGKKPGQEAGCPLRERPAPPADGALSGTRRRPHTTRRAGAPDAWLQE